jgi:hypothetical protein
MSAKAIAKKNFLYFLAFLRNSAFSKPEKTKFERQLNPTFQGCFDYPDIVFLSEHFVGI